MGVGQRLGEARPHPAGGLEQVESAEPFAVAQGGEVEGHGVGRSGNRRGRGSPAPPAADGQGPARASVGDDPGEGRAGDVLHAHQAEVAAGVDLLGEDADDVVVLEAGEGARASWPRFGDTLRATRRSRAVCRARKTQANEPVPARGATRSRGASRQPPGGQAASLGKRGPGRVGGEGHRPEGGCERRRRVVVGRIHRGFAARVGDRRHRKHSHADDGKKYVPVVTTPRGGSDGEEREATHTHHPTPEVPM